MSGQINPAVSCVECQRRKQRCNRQFPCNHCTKRGVAHLCRFIPKPTTTRGNKSDSSIVDDSSRDSKNLKRALESSEGDPDDGLAYPDNESSSFDASNALNALGYMPHTHHLVLGRGNGPKVDIDTLVDDDKESSEELKAALSLVPPKRYTDILVDNWLNGANYHYCALYPPEFRAQYHGYWAQQTKNQTPELISLILRVCASSLLFIIDQTVKERLESEIGTDCLTYAMRLHKGAEKLSTKIPHGKGGLVHVQQLFLTAFWYKSAEKWTEAWHALSAAIRAAYEIGLHQDSSSEGMSEFDREMRRRLWSILYLWDFALGSMLKRPALIDRGECSVEMPTMALEIDPGQSYQPSPFRHMKLHCQMCIDLAKEITAVPADRMATELAPRLRGVVERWFKNLPAEYAVENPETRWDDEYDWVVFQRRYLHLVGYMSLFGPLKPYLTRNSAEPMTESERELREAGVGAALALMDVSWSFFENLVSVGASFHYAVFCIFDTATALCSAFVHDEARNLPQREVGLEAIKKGMRMLEKLHAVSKTTSDLCRILNGLLRDLPLSSRELNLIGIKKRVKRVSATKAAVGKKAAQVDQRLSSEARGGPWYSPVSGSDASFSADSEEPDESHIGQNPMNRQHRDPSLKLEVIDPPAAALSEAGPPSVPSPASAPEFAQPGQPQLDEPTSENGGTAISGIPSPQVQSDSYGLPDDQAGLHDFQYVGLPSGGFDVSGAPTSQGGWVVLEAPSHGDGYLEPNLVAFDPNMPTVLEYWDWQGLDLGHPGYWGAPPPL
ncbi:hypothetical protein QBC39DRAFT_340470 [Podospora conica]|nr:hypothetical protein QBC39DRAFT_340470 [Schizothecium conicum]